LALIWLNALHRFEILHRCGKIIQRLVAECLDRTYTLYTTHIATA